MVHVTSRRFVRNEPDTTIKIYSNCDAVELLVNGRSLGQRSVDDHIATWSGVTLQPGANSVVALGRRGTDEIRDECVLTQEPAQHTRTP
jgi:beta-galactosidase